MVISRPRFIHRMGWTDEVVNHTSQSSYEAQSKDQNESCYDWKGGTGNFLMIMIDS